MIMKRNYLICLSVLLIVASNFGMNWFLRIVLALNSILLFADLITKIRRLNNGEEKD